MRLWHYGGGIVLAAMAAALCGCETQTSKVGVPTRHTDSVELPHPPPGSTDEAMATDPCAMRLQDIGGALLQYFALNKRLPARLEDVKTIVGVDQSLQFACPASGKPYGFAPAGLILEGRKKRIIIYDPTPAHDGRRWCVFMTDQRRPGAAQSLEVLAVPEAVFHLYLPADQ